MRDAESAHASPRRSVATGRRAVSLAFVIAGVVSAFALWRFAENLGPLNLSVAEERSTVVLDREGGRLGLFATRAGGGGLRVAPRDVDPRPLAMLKAYEDARFDRHSGVDPLALLRAGAQLVR